MFSNSIPIVSTGSVWTAKDAQFVLNEGAQAVGVARVALPHPDWAKQVLDPESTSHPCLRLLPKNCSEPI